MKKTLLIAALTMVSASAFASKARLNALSGSAHLVDVQNNFDQPWQAIGNGELATVEFGATGANAGSANAEGGFVRQWNDSYIGLYVGHQPTAMTGLLGKITFTGAAASDTTVKAWGLNNPFNVWYGMKSGDITWGANLFYLNSNLKNSRTFSTGQTAKDAKANAMGVSLGATNGIWDASLVLGLAGKASFTADTGVNASVNGATATAIPTGTEVEFSSKSNTKLMGGYKADTLYYYGAYSMGGGKLAVGGTDVGDFETTDITVGVVNSHKKDGTDFFYGIAYNMNTQKEKVGDSKTESSKLPLIVGIEADANSWLVLRGSLTQNFPLVGSTKTSTATASGDADTLADSTAVQGGVGMHFGKFMMDAFMATSTTGNIGFDSPNFLTQASLTYNF